jgi:hypothetical protein
MSLYRAEVMEEIRFTEIFNEFLRIYGFSLGKGEESSEKILPKKLEDKC